MSLKSLKAKYTIIKSEFKFQDIDKNFIKV